MSLVEEQTPRRTRGQIIGRYHDRSYCFIRPVGDGPDVFWPKRSNEEWGSYQNGDYVSFVIVESANKSGKLEATAIELID